MTTSHKHWRRMSLGAKLTLSNFLLVAAVLTVFVMAISYSVSRTLEARATTEVNEKTRMLTDLIEGADKDLRVRTGALAQSFQSSLKGTFELDAHPIDIKGLATPTLKLDKKPLNLDFQAVDRFTEMTGAVATVSTNEVTVRELAPATPTTPPPSCCASRYVSVPSVVLRWKQTTPFELAT